MTQAIQRAPSASKASPSGNVSGGKSIAVRSLSEPSGPMAKRVVRHAKVSLTSRWRPSGETRASLGRERYLERMWRFMDETRDVMGDRPFGGRLRAVRRLVVAGLWTLLCMPVQALLLLLPGHPKVAFARLYWRAM